MTEPKTKPASAPAEPKTASLPKINPALIDTVEVALDGFLGSARMTVGELSALEKGGVITLDATLNTAVELRLNGVAVARGELVAVGENFAVRLTEIAS